MSHSTGATNLSHILASEARLSRLHRLFKTQFNVTEPSLILEPYLFLGNCISAHDTHRLTKLGIRYILNVAIRDVELCPYYSSDIRAFTIDLRDDDRENILRTFDQAFAFIDEAKRTKSRVLVHCSHGQSRSPAIVIGYLMRTYNVSLEQCLTHVVKARPCVLPNDGFLRQLILYDRFLIDRRQRQEKAALMKAVNAAPPTEIPIQHNAPQPTVPPTEPANAPNLSSIDSSSLEPTSLSSIQSSISADSIHVVPIQVSSKTTRSEKVEPIQIKKVSLGDTPVTQELKKNVEHSKDKHVLTDLATVPSKSNVQITSSKHAAPSKKRQNVVGTNIVKRSHSAYSDHTHVNDGNHSSAEHWNVLTYYPPPNDQTRTKYITEIYDKATNRFIPTC